MQKTNEIVVRVDDSIGYIPRGKFEPTNQYEQFLVVFPYEEEDNGLLVTTKRVLLAAMHIKPVTEEEADAFWKELDAHNRKTAQAEADQKRRRMQAEQQQRADRVSALKAAMIARQRADRDSLQRFMESRDIGYLYHFTRSENLLSIINNGILPRADLPSASICNDPLRLDSFPEALCLSMSYINYRMFWHYRQEAANWAVIAISTSIFRSVPCLFYPTNAANRQFRSGNDDALAKRMGLQGLSSMFADDPPGLRGELELKPKWTTDPQAEILAFGLVPTDKFDGVGLLEPDPALEKSVHSILPGLRVVVAPRLFQRRSDFEYWRAN